MKLMEKTWPRFLKLQSLGKSYGKRDIWMMTVNNPATGAEMNKSAMFIEANVHGNEIQGTEVSLYTLWYLMENYDRIPTVKRLVDERVFYVLPTWIKTRVLSEPDRRPASPAGRGIRVRRSTT